MYFGLIGFAIVLLLGFAAVVFFTTRSDRAFARRVELLILDPKPIKRDNV